MATPRFRAAVLLDARRKAKLTQLQLATRAVEAIDGRPAAGRRENEAIARRIRTWESRIGAWERGVDAPTAPYIPTLARLLHVKPLSLFEVDPAAPPFTALRLAAGWTLQALAAETGLSYTSLYRMVRGVTHLPDDMAGRLAKTLGVTRTDLRASIEREQR